MFHFIASTGRTATTFLADALNRVDGCLACHEGHEGGAHGGDGTLPLINLENRKCFYSADFARQTIDAKRSEPVINAALESNGSKVLVDVAYYNAGLAEALLAQHPETRMVGIIRDCESFVRSATAMTGEDPMPVGWPDGAKPLSQREKFIGMGRLKPAADTPETASWKAWSAIEKNIWLWRETNLHLLRSAKAHPQRSLILKFESLKADQVGFLRQIIKHFQLECTELERLIRDAAAESRNTKPSGYQVGQSDSWSQNEQAMLHTAIEAIESEDEL